MVKFYPKWALANKRETSSDLLRHKISIGGEIWCVLSDFNYVFSVVEYRDTHSLHKSEVHDEIFPLTTSSLK